MESQEQSERREVYYSGRVQGVGFRYTARSIARQFAVTGYVRNLSDGGVELVVEGRPEVIRGFLREIRAELGHYIRDVRESSVQPTGSYDSFEVKF
jgi:acylphosphatase